MKCPGETCFIPTAVVPARAVQESDARVLLCTSAAPLKPYRSVCESRQQKACCAHDSCSCVVTEFLSVPAAHASLGENVDSQKKTSAVT